MIRWRRVLGACAGFAATPAAAHPLDEVVQSAYLTLAPGEVRLQLDLTPGPLVVEPMLRSLDANGDQSISDAEALAYGARVLRLSELTLDGTPTALRLEKVVAPPYRALRVAGDTLKIYAVASRPERAGARTLRYRNRYRPAASQCIANVFLQAGADWGYRVTGQERGEEGRSLAVAYATVAAAKPK